MMRELGVFNALSVYSVAQYRSLICIVGGEVLYDATFANLALTYP